MSKARERRSKSSAFRQEPQRGGDPADQAWQRAVRWLAAHDRSEQELRLRLGALEITPAVIDQTIGRLRALRYLDETRFAHVTAEQAARRGRGSDYVRAQLVAKGVPEQLIDAAIGTAFADEAALARQVLSGRYQAPAAHRGARGKAARFLLQRGFPEAVVAAVVEDDG